MKVNRISKAELKLVWADKAAPSDLLTDWMRSFPKVPRVKDFAAFQASVLANVPAQEKRSISWSAEC